MKRTRPVNDDATRTARNIHMLRRWSTLPSEPHLRALRNLSMRDARKLTIVVRAHGLCRSVMCHGTAPYRLLANTPLEPWGAREWTPRAAEVWPVSSEVGFPRG
jgi:hypothetical protein